MGQNKIAIFAGAQANGTKYTVVDIKQKSDFKFGYQAGISMKVPFDSKLFFAPAVFYSMKGYAVTFKNYAFPPDVTAKDNSTTLQTVELAGLLQLDFSSKPSHLFLKAGPSLDFQLIGKEKYNLINGSSVKRNMTFGFGDYGHFSANMIAQLGYETKSGFMVFAQYNHGLSNINNADNGPQILHRVYGISVGKYLKRK
jgi:hypothetical protein